MISVFDLKQIYLTLRSDKGTDKFYEILSPITDSDHLDQQQLDGAKVPFDVFIEFVHLMTENDKEF